MPPTVKKQEPRPRMTPSPNGSVLSEAMDIGDIADDFITMVIYGQNRVGKTHLAGQFPRPILLVVYEPNKTGGTRTLRRSKDITVVKIGIQGTVLPSGAVQQEKGMEKSLRLAAELQERCDWKTVVIDSATTFQDIILTEEVLKLDAVPVMLKFKDVSMDQYRERSEKCREGLRPFFNVAANVVVICKEKDHNPPKDERGNALTRGAQAESFFAADLGGATVKWLQDACDYIGRLYIESETQPQVIKGFAIGDGKPPPDKIIQVPTGRTIRCLRTMLHQNFAAGFRSEYPEAVPEFITDPSYAKIAKVIRGEKLTAAEGGHYPT